MKRGKIEGSTIATRPKKRYELEEMNQEMTLKTGDHSYVV